MKHLAIILSILGLPYLGFSQQTINGTITHGGIQRDYILYVPANYTGSTSVPLVFNFHGYGSNASEQMGYGDFRSIADSVGFIIVHPMGTLDSMNITHFNVGWGGSAMDDVGFSEALLDSVSAAYNIDPTRVYSTGMSNGGYMSFYLACRLSDRIAAIASVTGSMTPLQYNTCNPQHPTPILQMHGTIDAVVPYNGANWTRSINDVMQYWIDYNACNPTPTITMLPNTNTLDGSTVEHIVHKGGINNVSSEHFKVTGGGHTWPGSSFVFPGTNYDIDASVEIWKFFSKYDINGFIDTTTGLKPLNENNRELNIYPNPTHSHIWIELDYSEEVEYKLISLLGKHVLTGVINSNDQKIDLSGLPPSVYFLKVNDQTIRIVKTE